MSNRTFKIQEPHMRGDDVRAWQNTLQEEVERWGVKTSVIDKDGDYGVATRSLTSIVLKYMGFAQDLMVHGVTPDLRIKVRNRDFTEEERERLRNRTDERRKWVREQNGGGVALPVSKIIQDSWGYHPGVHDGIDLICPPFAGIYAICEARVIRVSDSGWWGLGAPSDPALRSRGDGIISIKATQSIGPIKEGMNICYGHAEGACVKEGAVVRAGQRLGHAGFANAWHVHWMINRRSDDRGVGDMDPREILNYCKKEA